MTRYYLARLQVEGFRGINNNGSPLDLRFKSDAVNSIWAPNGLGKSSIFEALCLAIRGDVPKLRKLEAAERPGDYYCNRFHGGDATIQLTFSSDDGTDDVEVQVVRTALGERVVTSRSGHSSPEELLSALDEDHTLLDYTTFSTFIDDSALDRGRSFSSLLGMAHLSNVRQALEQLSNRGNLTRDFDVAALKARRKQLDEKHTAAVRSLRSGCQKLLGAPPAEPLDTDAIVKDVTDALSAIQLLSAAFEDHTIMDVSFSSLTEAVKRAERSEDQEKLATAIQQTTALKKLAPGDTEAEERGALEAAVNDRDAAFEATRGELFQRMYQAVQAVLESGEWDQSQVCPVCESAPSTPPGEHVAEHLAAFATAADKDVGLSSLWTSAACVRRLRDLEAAPAMEVPEDDRTHASLDGTFHAKQGTKDVLANFIDRLDTLEASRQAKLGTLVAERTRIEKDLPDSLVTLTEQLEAAKELREDIETHRAGEDPAGERASVTRKQMKRRLWATFIEAATVEFANAEAEFSRKQAAGLKNRYQDMYKAICPRAEIVPSLQRSGTERLDLRLEKFFDLDDLSARPLLSESYRNAFGISVFLSAALEKKSAPRFMVLDDITSSFDAGHQWFLMELLRTKVAQPENNDGVQLIVLSHDGLLEKYFDRLSNQKSWHHHRLQGQSPTGTVLSEAQDANRLRADAVRFLSVAQMRQAEPLIRQYLEYKLTQVMSKVRIPAPLDFVIRDDRRMVRNCLDCISEAVDLNDRAGGLVLEPDQVNDLKNTHVPSIVGNWVSHYETGAISSLAPSVLVGVLDSIDEFAECFRYADSAGIRRYYKSLTKKD